MKKVYTLGYSGRKPEDIAALLEEKDATLLDIRMSNRSRVVYWNGYALQRLLGARYLWVPSLGNANYKTGGEIRISNYAIGKAQIESVARPAVILMCGCTDFNTCHRKTVAQMLQADGYEVEELRLDPFEKKDKPQKPPKPDQLTLF